MRLYIDPGTGSMLFAILVGVLGAAVYMFKAWLVKLRFFLHGGKGEAAADTERQSLVLFSDDKRYYSVFLPVLRELDARSVDVSYMTASPDDPALDCPLPHVHPQFIGEGNRAFAKLNFIKADVVLSTTPGLDVYQWKRSKDVRLYLHLLHAASEVSTYRMFGLDYYDAVMTSGDYQERDIRELESMRGTRTKQICKIGIPYMDDMLRRLREAPPLPPHERTVLLAPSWGKSAIFCRIGGSIIDKLLSTGYHIIIRPHPQSFTSEKDMIESLMAEYPDSPSLEWNRDSDNFEVLRRADILISDFSGVIFDFALVYDKPVIYASADFDYGPYDAWWLERPLWTFSALPRIGRELTKENAADLRTMIDECLTDSRFAEGRREVRGETWAYPGEGAVRAADFIEKKLAEASNTRGEK